MCARAPTTISDADAVIAAGPARGVGVRGRATMSGVHHARLAHRWHTRRDAHARPPQLGWPTPCYADSMAQRRPRPRAPFVVTVIATSAAGLMACGGNVDGGAGGSSGSGGTAGSSGAGAGGTGAVNPPPPDGCPRTMPQYQTRCAVSKDLRCIYPTGECCPDMEARCVDGVWQTLISSCNPPPPDPCPTEAPAAGSSCAPEYECGASPYECNYDEPACETGVVSQRCDRATLTWSEPWCAKGE